jgi:hypothetical protein
MVWRVGRSIRHPTINGGGALGQRRLVVSRRIVIESMSYAGFHNGVPTRFI